MEFMTGERETQVSTLREIFEEQPLGKEVTVEGAHCICDRKDQRRFAADGI